MHNYKNFSGGYTALGTSITGAQPLQGYLRGICHTGYYSDYDHIMAMYGEEVSYKYDGLSRLLNRGLHTGIGQFKTTYEYYGGDTYDFGANITTARIKSILNDYEGLKYSYDRNGNITDISGYETDCYGNLSSDNLNPIKYYYNELNELIREDNAVLNKTIAYSYDSDGKPARQ